MSEWMNKDLIKKNEWSDDRTNEHNLDLMWLYDVKSYLSSG